MERMELGWTVRDSVTGFYGVVTGRVEYLTGCAQLLVQPGVKDDGEWRESRWFDETRVVRVGGSVVKIPTASKTDGPDKPAPRK